MRGTLPSSKEATPSYQVTSLNIYACTLSAIPVTNAMLDGKAVTLISGMRPLRGGNACLARLYGAACHHANPNRPAETIFQKESRNTKKPQKIP
jgi:hypothetical protein